MIELEAVNQKYSVDNTQVLMPKLELLENEEHS